MKYLFLISLFLVLLGLFLWFRPDKFKTTPSNYNINGEIPKSEIIKQSPATETDDIERQKPLANPPEAIKALYATSWSAGNKAKVDKLIDLIKKAKLNAIVIDIKDYSGYVAYDIDVDDVIKYKAKKIQIPKINSLIKKLHDENIYVIARIVVFQDPILAAAKPDWAVKNKTTGKLWKDKKGLAWIDPAARESWDYIIEIAQDASQRGFDEINFDYIRFPSDGELGKMSFPFYNPKTAYKRDVIKEFFVYLRSHLAGIKTSIDVFGLTTISKDDLGIGQVIEDAYQNFDFISPMVYPSHYTSGTLGYKNPASYPYEIVKYSMENAVKRLGEYNKIQHSDSESDIENTAKIRPWLQAFDLGDKYDAAKVKIQMKASDQSGGVGWMLWNPSNDYSRILKINE